MEPIATAVAVTPDAVDLHDAFLAAGIVSPKSSADALHVALATSSGCTAIVSWNFRHIVHALRMPLYNGVSVARGYLAIGIHSPPEVLVYGP